MKQQMVFSALTEIPCKHNLNPNFHILKCQSRDHIISNSKAKAVYSAVTSEPLPKRSNFNYNVFNFDLVGSTDMAGIIYVYVDTLFGFYGTFFH